MTLELNEATRLGVETADEWLAMDEGSADGRALARLLALYELAIDDLAHGYDRWCVLMERDPDKPETNEWYSRIGGIWLHAAFSHTKEYERRMRDARVFALGEWGEW